MCYTPVFGTRQDINKNSLPSQERTSGQPVFEFWSLFKMFYFLCDESCKGVGYLAIVHPLGVILLK